MIPHKLVLLATSLSLASATIPRGVSPEDAKLYVRSSSESFTCLTHPSTTIPFSRVNDDFCDCPDGSDEPGTAACAILPHKNLSIPGFYCRNNGHTPAFLPLSRVNDGICDYDICCDGSDEYAGVGGTKCPSRCKEIGTVARKMAAERGARRAKARKTRDGLVKQALVLRKELEDNIAITKLKITANEAKVKELEVKLKETEEAERRKVVRNPKPGSRVSVVTQVASEKVEELKNLLDKVRNERNAAEDRLNKTEAILKALKEGYNPNFNDDGVKTAVREWEEYLANGYVEQKRNAAEDRDLTAAIDDVIDWDGLVGTEEEIPELYQFTQYLPPTARDWLSSKMEQAREFLIANGVLAPPKSAGAESPVVAAAREVLRTAETDKENNKRHLETLENDLKAEFGPGDVFRPLKGTCVSREFGEYNYELCFMDKAYQISRKDNSKTSLGSFSKIEVADESSKNEAAGVFATSWEENHEEPLTGIVHKHDNGQQCWNGPKRSVAIELYCSAENEIRAVVEAEKCVYRFEVGTPAVCDDDAANDGGAAQMKDEL